MLTRFGLCPVTHASLSSLFHGPGSCTCRAMGGKPYTTSSMGIEPMLGGDGNPKQTKKKCRAYLMSTCLTVCIATSHTSLFCGKLRVGEIATVSLPTINFKSHGGASMPVDRSFANIFDRCGLVARWRPKL